MNEIADTSKYLEFLGYFESETEYTHVYKTVDEKGNPYLFTGSPTNNTILFDWIGEHRLIVYVFDSIDEALEELLTLWKYSNETTK